MNCIERAFEVIAIALAIGDGKSANEIRNEIPNAYGQKVAAISAASDDEAMADIEKCAAEDLKKD